MKSGSSASIDRGLALVGLAVHDLVVPAVAAVHRHRAPVRFTTSTCCTVSVPGLDSAWSTLALSGTFLPPRMPSSAVITTVEAQSEMRPASESGENPPNTTEWIAPMRAQASIATAASGIIGR